MQPDDLDKQPFSSWNPSSLKVVSLREYKCSLYHGNILPYTRGHSHPWPRKPAYDMI